MLDKSTYRSLKAKVSIDESKEEMLEIPKEFLRFSPHPYEILGAPYGDKSPFFLRSSVIEKLLLAQERLSSLKPEYKLKVFDGFRPLSVQIFMIEYEKNRLSQEMFSLVFNELSIEKKCKIEDIVAHFWSPLYENIELNPPPHSTGGALDLTIVDENENELDMGTKIDELVEGAQSDFYYNTQTSYQTNRELLFEVMSFAGFTQLPTEWWHFSYGDQIWAIERREIKEQEVDAIYSMV